MSQAEPSMLFKENFNGRVICFHYQENWGEMEGGQGRQRIEHHCSIDLPRPGHRVIIDQWKKKCIGVAIDFASWSPLN